MYTEVVSTISDADGAFEVHDIPSGYYTVVATRSPNDGLEAAIVHDVDVGRSSSPTEIALDIPPFSSILGHIESESLTTVQGLEIVYRCNNGVNFRRDKPQTYRARVNADGQFNIEMCPSGDGQVYLELPIDDTESRPIGDSRHWLLSNTLGIQRPWIYMCNIETRGGENTVVPPCVLSGVALRKIDLSVTRAGKPVPGAQVSFEFVRLKDTNGPSRSASRGGKSGAVTNMSGKCAVGPLFNGFWRLVIAFPREVDGKCLLDNFVVPQEVEVSSSSLNKVEIELPNVTVR